MISGQQCRHFQKCPHIPWKVHQFEREHFCGNRLFSTISWTAKTDGYVIWYNLACWASHRLNRSPSTIFYHGLNRDFIQSNWALERYYWQSDWGGSSRLDQEWVRCTRECGYKNSMSNLLNGLTEERIRVSITLQVKTLSLTVLMKFGIQSLVSRPVRTEVPENSQRKFFLEKRDSYGRTQKW